MPKLASNRVMGEVKARNMVNRTLNNFLKNAQVYGDNTRMNSRKEGIKIIVEETRNNPTIMNAFINRLMWEVDTKEVVTNLYEYLILALKSVAGLMIEMEGMRVVLDKTGTKRKMVTT